MSSGSKPDRDAWFVPDGLILADGRTKDEED